MRRKLQGPLAALLGIAMFVIGAGPASAACPNEDLRTGPSALLPDCRAYELVSPARKNGYDVEKDGVRAAASGAGVTYTAKGAAATSPSTPIFAYFLGRRAEDGLSWGVKGVSPPINPVAYVNIAPFYDWSADLSKGVMQTLPNAPLTPDANPLAADLYLRDNVADTYALISHQSFIFPSAAYGGASEDFGHIVFGDEVPQTADSPEGMNNLYDATSTGVELVSRAPGSDEPLATGGVLGSGETEGSTDNAVSDDGSRIFFTAFPPGGSAPQVFARIDGTSSVEVSASQRETPDPAGESAATYWTAAADGSVVFFTSHSELTDNANTGDADAGTDLYRYDVDDEQLLDVSLDTTGLNPNGAEVLGVVGADENGRRVYFVAAGQLVPGQGVAGEPNLYLWDEGSIMFIATLSPEDAAIDWANEHQNLGSTRGARVSPDGRELAITTRSTQPGYDNAGHSEIYRFALEVTPTWDCVSCGPDDQPATADAALAAPFGELGPSDIGYTNRALDSAHGAVFFNTAEAHDAADTNEVIDAYQWRDGEISLISSGTSEFPSYFADADAGGENVYITTRAALVAADEDNLADVYDARIDGGIPAAPGPPAPCVGEGCRGPGSQPAPAPAPNSSSFSGPGDPKPVHRARHHRRKQHHKKQHKRRHAAHPKRTSRG